MILAFKGLMRTLATVTVLTAASTAYGNILAPGDCAGLHTAACPGTVTDFGDYPGFPVLPLADTGVVSFTSLGGLFSGKLDEWVVRNSVTTRLDFVFQVHLDSTTDAILLAETNRFDSFVTDVGYTSHIAIAAMGLGSIRPDAVDRLTSDVIGSNLSNREGIEGGETSELFVIKTNALEFGPGLIFLHGTTGDMARVSAFAPVVPAPEPSSLILIGTAILGLAGAIRRRSERL